MKKMSLFATLILVCGLFVPALYAEQHGCTTANVAGTYGYEGFGTVTNTTLFGLTGEYSSVGTLTFDGKGNLLIADTSRIGDVVTETLYVATYKVTNPNQCIVTFTITQFGTDPHFKLVFVDNRNKALGMSLIPGMFVNYVNTTKIAIDNQQ